MSRERNGRRLILALVVLTLIAAVILLRPVLMPFLAAALLAYLLLPAVRELQKRGVHIACAILVVYAYLFVGLAVLFSLCVPLVASQLRNLGEMLPQLAAQLLSGLSAATGQRWVQQGGAAAQWLSQLPEAARAALEAAGSQRLALYLDASADHLSGMLKTVLCLLLAPFLAFYFLRDRDEIAKAVLNWVPIREREAFLELAGKIDRLLRQFVRGYLLIAAVVALAAAMFYWCLGLDNALALGLIMGVADLIPYLGPILGAIPALAVAFPQGNALFLATGFGILALQQLEAAVLTPKIMDTQVGLHPLVTILAVLAGGWLWGALGAILAVPLMAIALLVLKYGWDRLVGVKIF